MRKKSNRPSSKIGLPPGTLIHLGEKRMDKTKISILSFGEGYFSEVHDCEVEKVQSVISSGRFSWINVDGIHDVKTIEKIGKVANLSPLLMEDVLNTYQRPKFEDYGTQLYVNCKMIGLGLEEDTIVSEQLGLVLGENYILSFQEQEGDIFSLIRDRIREDKGQIRSRTSDYIFYRLIDIVVDNYFLVTEHFTNMSEELERKILEKNDKSFLIEIQKLKKTLIRFRRMIVPMREVVNGLYKEDNGLISEATKPFLRDVYEHVIQVMEWVENQRDMANSTMDLYHTEVSNRMNSVMQLLTVISTIFIPITFVAGIYGMNFEFIPELKWKYGYIFFWSLIFLIILLMVIYFKKKKWF